MSNDHGFDSNGTPIYDTPMGEGYTFEELILALILMEPQNLTIPPDFVQQEYDISDLILQYLEDDGSTWPTGLPAGMGNTASDLVVLGQFTDPLVQETAEALDADHLLGDGWSVARQNAFISQLIERGRTAVVIGGWDAARPGSVLEDEILTLLESGYSYEERDGDLWLNPPR